MTDLQAKRKAIKSMKKAQWRRVDDYAEFIILFLEPNGGLSFTPCPNNCTLKQARRILHDYPTGKLFWHVYVPV